MEYLHDTIIYKMLAVQKKLVSAVKSDFTEVDITHENYITLHFIYENPGISQTELAKLNSRDKNVIVKTIDRLEKNGWMERRIVNSDRRTHSLFVTEEGEKIIRKYWSSLVEKQNAALSPLSEEEKRQLNQLLKKILN